MYNGLSRTELDNFFHIWGEAAEIKCRFRPGVYSKYNVKRGLRNEDGSGVLVGLTKIGDVHAYVIDENEKVPVEGRLTYRGIDIYDLVEGFLSENRFGFEECAYLLLHGDLPTERELELFKNVLASFRSIPEDFVRTNILSVPSHDIMNQLARLVLIWYSYDDNPDDTSVKNLLRQSVNLISKFPLMAAYSYQAKCHYFDGKSLVIHKPRYDLSTAENLLMLLRPSGEYTPLEAKILDLALVLHAEHGGGNNSTFAAHVVSSSGTDIYSSLAAAIGSLKGPKHGGANSKVIGMMDELKREVKDWRSDGQIRDYLARIVRKEAFDRTGLIYGMGHAVYTLSDPRCILLREQAEKLACQKGRMEEYELHKRVEKLAPEVFREIKKSDKPMCANIDFYSGFVYDMLDIPMEMNTPIFAVSRVVGWCAHIIEENLNGGRIIRPAYKNIKRAKEYIGLQERS
ncbi:MAG: citrate/2-methylcitrate synthase [Clostridiaceae bacterium]|jgi:citrate synthase|nr:citrate/2-methylcitrate synthase [Bacillota bacterium]NLI39094.1 citrate/2-methylcitrate synthase [Clostridiaceae bacterium]